jgi:hypothetical protein
MSSLLEELPFYNRSTELIEKYYEKEQYAMKTLMNSYGFNCNRIMSRLSAAKAFIGGSTATHLQMKDSINFQPGDIDIYIEDTYEHRSAAKSAVKYMKICGYEVDVENSFTDFLGKMKTSYTPDNDHIKEIWSMKNETIKKNIQIVLLDMEPSKYIIEETDLSCTSIAISCTKNSDGSFSSQYAQENVRCLKKKLFYVNAQYHDIYDDKCGEKKREKLMSRIRKYEERGFKFIGKSADACSEGEEYFMRFDKIPRIAKKYMVHSVNDFEEVTLYAALRRDDSIVIYVNAEKGYLVNRKQFYEYCNNNDKTYWGHTLYRNKMEMSCAPMVLFEMYRFYVLRRMHDGNCVLEPKMVKDVIGEKGLCF